MPSLTDKLVTEDEIKSAMSYDQHSNARRAIVSVFGADNPPQWAIREQARISASVYEVTNALKAVNKAFPVFAHISTEDRKMVAYTPDRAAGEADRQIRTTPGRLFSKYMPMHSDTHIATLASEHRAEACAEITWVSGFDIVTHYKEFSSGVGGCMSNNSGTGVAFKDWEHHPAEVYDAPKIKLALFKDESGVVKARSLVYEPSETDKRFIRCYGSPVLQKLLVRSGYSAGSLSGATLKKIPAGRGEGTYIMPYLDSDGGCTTPLGSSVVIINGEMRVADAQIRELLEPTEVNVSQAGNTAGWMAVEELTAGELNFICAITGVTFSRLEFKPAFVWLNGAKVPVQQGLVKGAGPKPAWVEARYCGSRIFALVEETTTLDRMLYVKDEGSMRWYGFSQLSATHYPVPQWDKNPVYTSDSQCILEEDACYVIASGSRTVVHKSAITKQHVLLSPLEGRKTYTLETSNIARTKSKAKVIVGLHGVAINIFGDLDFERNMRSVYLDEGFVYVPKKLKDTSAILASVGLEKVRRKYRAMSIEKLVFEHADIHGSAYVTVHVSPEVIIPLGVSGIKRNIPQLMAANPVSNYEAIYAAFTPGYWQRRNESESMKITESLIRAEFVARLADMQAVEAPHYLADMPVEIEPIITIETPELEGTV